MSEYHAHAVPTDDRVQKRESGPLEQGSQKTVRRLWLLGCEPSSSVKNKYS